MVPFRIIFFVTVALTVASGIAAAALVTFGDTRNDSGQRAVASAFAQIALLGATAIVALIKIPGIEELTARG